MPLTADTKKVMFEIYRDTSLTGQYKVVYFTELGEHDKDTEIADAMRGEHIFDGFLLHRERQEGKQVVEQDPGAAEPGREHGPGRNRREAEALPREDSRRDSDNRRLRRVSRADLVGPIRPADMSRLPHLLRVTSPPRWNRKLHLASLFHTAIPKFIFCCPAAVLQFRMSLILRQLSGRVEVRLRGI